MRTGEKAALGGEKRVLAGGRGWRCRGVGERVSGGGGGEEGRGRGDDSQASGGSKERWRTAGEGRAAAVGRPTGAVGVSRGSDPRRSQAHPAVAPSRVPLVASPRPPRPLSLPAPPSLRPTSPPTRFQFPRPTQPSPTRTCPFPRRDATRPAASLRTTLDPFDRSRHATCDSVGRPWRGRSSSPACLFPPFSPRRHIPSPSCLSRSPPVRLGPLRSGAPPRHPNIPLESRAARRRAGRTSVRLRDICACACAYVGRSVVLSEERNAHSSITPPLRFPLPPIHQPAFIRHVMHPRRPGSSTTVHPPPTRSNTSSLNVEAPRAFSHPFNHLLAASDPRRQPHTAGSGQCPCVSPSTDAAPLRRLH